MMYRVDKKNSSENNTRDIFKYSARMLFNILIIIFFMKEITREDYSELLTEIIHVFCYLIQSQLAFENFKQQFKDEEEIVLLMEDFCNNKIYGYPVWPLYDAVCLLKFSLLTFETEPKKILINRYKKILNSYIDVGYPVYGFENKKLRNRINGIKNIKKRYEDNLYKKREILYRVLRETAKQKGKWHTVNQAVRDVYPQLEQEFQKFNVQWTQQKMNHLRAQIKQNEIAMNENKKSSFDDGRINFQDRAFENKINKYKKDYEKLAKALKLGNISEVMGKTLAFHSDYQEEAIINHLRACPELLLEIICEK